MKIDIQYDYGEIVYLVTDKEQSPRLVTGWKQVGGVKSDILYLLCCGVDASEHFSAEISRERNDVLYFSN